MARGHKQYFITGYEIGMANNNFIYSRQVNIGNASTLASAKAMISRYRRARQGSSPQNFNVYDCWAEVDEETGFVPCVYHED